MTYRILKTFGSSAAIAVLALSGAAPALAAKRHHRAHSARANTTNTTTSSTETALTGTTLSSATAAALSAVPGGTVTHASTETDSSTSTAAYEVHVTKSDGSQVVVIEDSSFGVLSVAAGTGHCA